MREVKIRVYNFQELSPSAQHTAVGNHRTASRNILADLTDKEIAEILVAYGVEFLVNGDVWDTSFEQICAPVAIL